ncbi:YbhB/YbcL family Raf kinase inhibitor-like protein [Desulfogranum mediterraneum]|uniref:YbhB/YbcL family Raf kinase inhibitor-like protein n=1 Tax=Desulfogranum mediterraneum TaxID=160661 RepID=UPI0003F52A41|nr:YbhB/YbcL family Raf kinase inhibitor-like protein [Desulfogranum mediterraneum]
MKQKELKQIGMSVVLSLIVGPWASAADFTLTSPQLTPGGKMQQEQLFKGFGCNGENISPELHWQGEPSGTRSFALTMYDPDAPTGSGWWHWIVFNIPAERHKLEKNSGGASPTSKNRVGIQSRTDFGSTGYGGACPPAGHGAHRYQFRIWALDTPHLELDDQASGAMVGYFLNQHALAQAELTVSYGR